MSGQLPVILALSVWTSGAPAKEGPAKELDALQGTWKLQEKAGGADRYPWPYIEKNGWVRIAGEKATLVIREGGKDMKLAEFTFKIDASKSPKTAVLTIEFIAPEGDKAPQKGEKLYGIYALDGDTLKLMIGDEKRPPRAFPEKGDDGVSTLKREKKK